MGKGEESHISMCVELLLAEEDKLIWITKVLSG